MQSNMSVVKSSKVSKVVKILNNSVAVGVVKKKSIKKNNLSIVCCGALRGDKMTTMFRDTMKHCQRNG